MKNSLLPVTLIASLSLTGCTYVLEHLPGVYTIDIKQGNIIDQDMIDQLHPNMSKRQVLYIMGSPMLSDYFHKQRWDYIYSVRKNGDQEIAKRVALLFNGDNLVGIEGDFKPNATVAIKPSKEMTVDIPPRKLDQTLFEKIASWFDFTPDKTSVAINKDRPTDLGPSLDKPFQLP